MASYIVLMKRVVHASAVVLLLLTSGALNAQVTDLVVYEDALRNGWQDWSWATHSLVATAYVHSGTRSISFVPAGWAAVYPHLDAGVSGDSHDGLDFWVNGGAASGQNLRIVFVLGQTTLANVALSDYLPGGPTANTWRSARIAFDSIGLSSALVDGIYFQDGTGGTQATVYLDDITFTARSSPPPSGSVTVAVDPSANRRPISPYIYGVSLTGSLAPGQPAYPVRRWGGNATTRYNWQVDASNRAADWFYLNIPEATPNPATLPDNSTADLFIDDCRAHCEQPLLTVPLIGWTPVDRQVRWGFSVSKYGAQQQTECTATGNPSWCRPDAGNGVMAGGGNVTGNDPYDTSIPITESFVTAWMQHMIGRVGTAAQGGLKFYALDNEPALWNSTHRDVHPTPLNYAELWSRTQTYAAAIKATDPGALTFGPVAWGWCEYFYSAGDGCGPGADYAAHGPLLAWYLDQVQAYLNSQGVRLVDYLDIHYYPQSGSVALSEDESAGTAALRLRSLKSLYDPSYTDESWIGQAIQLVPRMKALIAAHAPGTKLAITEYNFGGDDGGAGQDMGVTAALAQAEVLAIFGREGVDLANRWVAPTVNSLVEDAFKLYLDYNGAGAQVSGESVSATSSSVDTVGAYAVRGASGQAYVLLFNKATTNQDAQVTVAGGLGGSNLALYGFDASNRLSSMGTVSHSGGVFTVSLPGRSARLAVGTTTPCAVPSAVSGVTLAKVSGGASVRLTWQNASGATSYEVNEDTAPNGAFATQTGTATDGTAGLTVPVASGLRYYLVTAVNACGPGPSR
jgi:hypothetical protein